MNEVSFCRQVPTPRPRQCVRPNWPFTPHPFSIPAMPPATKPVEPEQPPPVADGGPDRARTHALSRPQVPWTADAGIDGVVARWLTDRVIRPCLAADRALPPRPGIFAPLPASLPGPLRDALIARGVRQLYAHQAEATAAAQAGKHVVVATPTASGKSLCFHLPVLAPWRGTPTPAPSIFIPPRPSPGTRRRACATSFAMRDWLLAAVVYDGDTPGDARRAARERGRIVMTNPDMLHAGDPPAPRPLGADVPAPSLRRHRRAPHLQGRLRLPRRQRLRRLRRAARFHGSDPAFMAPPPPSATRANTPPVCFGVPERDRFARLENRRAPGTATLFPVQPAGGQCRARHPRELL